MSSNLINAWVYCVSMCLCEDKFKVLFKKSWLIEPSLLDDKVTTIDTPLPPKYRIYFDNDCYDDKDNIMTYIFDLLIPSHRAWNEINNTIKDIYSKYKDIKVVADGKNNVIGHINRNLLIHTNNRYGIEYDHHIINPVDMLNLVSKESKKNFQRNVMKKLTPKEEIYQVPLNDKLSKYAHELCLMMIYIDHFRRIDKMSLCEYIITLFRK